MTFSYQSDIVKAVSSYSYSTMIGELDDLQQLYPFIEVETVGQSVLGKAIPAVRIGTGEKHVHYNGAVHANEWITTVLLMKFIEDVSKSYRNSEDIAGIHIGSLFADTTLWIIPMVNPDGVELVQETMHADHPFYERLIEWNNGCKDFIDWKANIRGVDLNDQFPAYWTAERERRAIKIPAPRDYVGAAPLTEPEAVALAEFTKDHDFRLVISFHSQGQEIYWNYHDYEPEEAEDLAEELAEASGYRAVKLSGSDAGYKDWFIKEYRRPGFTVEVGIGNNPLPISQFNVIYKEVFPLMLQGLMV